MDGYYQPVFVAIDIKNHPIFPYNARGVELGFDIIGSSPLSHFYFSVPRPQGLFGICIAWIFPIFFESPYRNDSHVTQRKFIPILGTRQESNIFENLGPQTSQIRFTVRAPTLYLVIQLTGRFRFYGSLCVNFPGFEFMEAPIWSDALTPIPTIR